MAHIHTTLHSLTFYTAVILLLCGQRKYFLAVCGSVQLGNICLIQVQLDVHYILYFFLDNVSSKCFGCYLHPSSGAQLQRTAIGFVSVENRAHVVKK
jgi:hypothetical protein